jgi:antitoxin component YwqK of YwqJK toxin-antitoxin module
MRKILIVPILFFIWPVLVAQQEINPDGYNIFYFENGKVSSEGFMRNGNPDGYWKTYYENGYLKSEGNRKEFQLDSTWAFYSDSGKVVMQINYLNGKKNGIRKTFHEDEIIEENFVDDVKQGLTRYYYPDQKLWKEIVFIDGLEEGIGKEYADTDGRVIRLTYYRKGFITDIERINNIDHSGMRQGIWKFFYEDTGTLWLDGEFKNDLKHGYFKEFSKDGSLLSTSKYIDGILQENVAELAKLDIKTEYYQNGKPKVIASFKNGVPEGVRREYSKDGKIVAGYFFSDGIVVGEGIIDESGSKDGPWKEYYTNGTLKSEGLYNKGKRTGEWKFYHSNGKLEQTGNYNKDGKEDGRWTWYFSTGSLLREEFYFNGMIDGHSVEYDEFGVIIAEGDYIENNREGKWVYNYGDHKSEGEYLNDLRNGLWKNYYSDGVLSFQGEFVDDNPNGKHTWYWPNGNKKTEGFYSMGLKEGEWIKYNFEGIPMLNIDYENGLEKKYDGVKIKIYEEDNLPVNLY